MKKMIIPVLALLGMVACTNENEPEIINENGDPVEIKLNASVLQLDVLTRGIIAGNTFSENSEIGVIAWKHAKDTPPTIDTDEPYADLNNAKYTADNAGALTTTDTAHYPLESDSYLDFYAYFPKVESLTKNHIASYSLDDQNDIMYATPVTNKTKEEEQPIDLSFTHALNAMTIIVKKANDISEELNLSKISISIASDATFDISNGTIAPGTAQNKDLAITSSNITTDGVTFLTDYLIWPGTAPTFTLVINNKTYTVTPSKELKANTKMTYTFTVNAKDVTVKGSIGNWETDTDGGDIK